MHPVFPRINQAIRFTLEYYEVGRIREWMFRLAGTERGSSTPHILDTWREFVLDCHKGMEDEINQTIHTTNFNTQVYLFETLKEWLTDYRIEDVNETLICEKINSYNEKTYAEFLFILEAEIKKFQEGDNYYREHLEEYESIIHPLPAFFGLSGRSLYGKRAKHINYKYYCINDKPELIDTDYLPKYLPIVAEIIDNFKGIVRKYVSRYDAGKIVSTADIIVERKQIGNENPKTLLEPGSKENKKLKVNLSVPQLSYLFKKLTELKIVEASTATEIHRFIAANFQPNSKNENEDISIGKLANLWSEYDLKEIKFWTDKFIELHNLSKKDNPNRIK